MSEGVGRGKCQGGVGGIFCLLNYGITDHLMQTCGMIKLYKIVRLMCVSFKELIGYSSLGIKGYNSPDIKLAKRSPAEPGLEHWNI